MGAFTGLAGLATVARAGARRDPDRGRHRRHRLAPDLPDQHPGRPARAGRGGPVHPRVALGAPSRPRPGRRADPRRRPAGRALPADDGPRAGLAGLGLRDDGGRRRRAGARSAARQHRAERRGPRAAGRAQPLPRPRVRRRLRGADGAVRRRCRRTSWPRPSTSRPGSAGRCSRPGWSASRSPSRPRCSPGSASTVLAPRIGRRVLQLRRGRCSRSARCAPGRDGPRGDRRHLVVGVRAGAGRDRRRLRPDGRADRDVHDRRRAGRPRPASASGLFNTTTQLANAVGVAAARHAVLRGRLAAAESRPRRAVRAGLRGRAGRGRRPDGGWPGSRRGAARGRARGGWRSSGRPADARCARQVRRPRRPRPTVSDDSRPRQRAISPRSRAPRPRRQLGAGVSITASSGSPSSCASRMPRRASRKAPGPMACPGACRLRSCPTTTQGCPSRRARATSIGRVALALVGAASWTSPTRRAAAARAPRPDPPSGLRDRVPGRVGPDGVGARSPRQPPRPGRVHQHRRGEIDQRRQLLDATTPSITPAAARFSAVCTPVG